MQERCGRCADIQHKIKDYDIKYEISFMPPKSTDIDALEYPITEPVLVHNKKAPDGVVGHDEILDWIRKEVTE